MTNLSKSLRLKNRDFSCLREGWTFFTSSDVQITEPPLTDEDCEEVVAYLNKGLKSIHEYSQASEEIEVAGTSSGDSRESPSIWGSSPSILLRNAHVRYLANVENIFYYDDCTMVLFRRRAHRREPEKNYSLIPMRKVPNLRKLTLPGPQLPRKFARKMMTIPPEKNSTLCTKNALPVGERFLSDSMRFEKQLAGVETVHPLDYFMRNWNGGTITEWLERTCNERNARAELRRERAAEVLRKPITVSPRQREIAKAVRKEIEQEMMRANAKLLGINAVLEELRHLDNDKPITMRLTRAQKQRLKAILKQQSDVVATKQFDTKFRIDDLKALFAKNSVDNRIINFYMKLIVARSELRRGRNALPRVHAMSTFFVQRLESIGFKGVKNWTRKVDIFAMDLIVIPMCRDGMHWRISIIDLKNRTMKNYNSPAEPDTSILKLLEKYLRQESLDKKSTPFDTRRFDYVPSALAPVPKHDYDSGVFACMYAEYVSRNSPLAFSQKNVSYFRKKMVLEIANGALLN